MMMKLKFYNNLGLDSMSPDQELDPRVSPNTKQECQPLKHVF